MDVRWMSNAWSLTSLSASICSFFSLLMFSSLNFSRVKQWARIMARGGCQMGVRWVSDGCQMPNMGIRVRIRAGGGTRKL